MHTRVGHIKFLLTLVALVILAGVAPQALAQSSNDDPFYGQKGTAQIIEERRIAPFQQVQESVDPFTGNLNLLHTDVFLPGNGGQDLRIQRSYNSRIWGRRDASI